MTATTKTYEGMTWELQCVDSYANHDKFYRTLVFGNVTVTHFGRNGTAGQIKIHHHNSAHAAKQYALDKTAEKEDKKGYEMVRPPFEVTTSTPPAQLDANAVHRMFGSR